MKNYLWPLLLAVIAIGLPLIGAQFSYVDHRGLVHEPYFFTIPLGEAMLAIAVIWAVVLLVRQHRHAQR